MSMAVDQAGEDGLALEIDDASLLAFELEDCGARSGCGDASIANCHCANDAEAGVDGNDLCVVEDQVGRLESGQEENERKH